MFFYYIILFYYNFLVFVVVVYSLSYILKCAFKHDFYLSLFFAHNKKLFVMNREDNNSHVQHSKFNCYYIS